MRELRVEDALVYLDQVKVEFGDRPHIYNEFLEIMKTFKSQQIDTPGVIRRVSNLFQGNKKLVLGFNTFLPEGYKIESSIDGDGPPVFRAPGQDVAQVLSGPPPPARPDSNVASAPSSRRERESSQGSSSSKPKGPVPHPPGPPARKDSASLSQHQMRMPQPPLRHGGAGAPIHHQQHSPQTNPSAPPRGHQGHGMMIKANSDQTSAAPGPAPHVQRQQVQSNAPMHSYAQQAHRVQQSQTKPIITSEAAVRPPPTRGTGPGAGRVMHHRTQNVAPAGVGTPPMAIVGTDGKPPVISSRIGPGPPLPMTPQPQGSVQVSAPLPTGGPQRAILNQAPPQQAQQQPLEFDHAINYVTMIKKRFASEPETYKKFLEILHTYQREMRGIKEVLDEVSVLFADHPDLLEKFTYFLPEAVQAQAKAQLDQVVEEAEARKRASMAKQPVRPPEAIPKQPIREPSPPPQPQPPAPIRRPSYSQPAVLPIPFGATQGRLEERERDICRSAQRGVVSFAPVRPPRRSQPSPALAASKNGRPTAIPPLPLFPNTGETAFFERARNHLNRKELAPDKPPGSRRHTPYTEFLKCLHLFGSGILTKTELVMLLRGLFMQGHAPKSGANAGGGVSNPAVASDAHSLMREFEEILVGRGPYAQQEAAFKDKSKYGSLRTKNFDYSNCEMPTPSYRTYPADYPHCLFLANPGQSEEENAVLNNQVLCVGSELNLKKTGTRSIEDYDCIRIRHNAYEEAMFRIEDERYEVDLAIECNVQAMRQIEQFAEEVTSLKENEEKDGQPIGRLQYKLNKDSMNTIHINAIARVYGECGDEVLQHLVKNPLVVLPLVYQRLRQKDAEWRKAKLEMAERWNSLCEANYEGSLDHTCFPQRIEFERMFSPSRLLDDCQRAHSYYKHPEILKPHVANSAFGLEYAMKNSDPDALLFQSHVAVKMGKIAFMSHRDAIRLLIARIKTSSICSDTEREKVGRIWAEFMVPWFGLPVHWVAEEVRQSFRGRLGPNVVKYSPGQNVVTDYGHGQILAFLEGQSAVEARYRVKLNFGVALLRPSSVMHLVAPADGTTFIRKDGVMMKDENPEFAGQALFAEKLSNKFKLMFGTEGIYVFLRLYCLLLSLLTDTREYLSIANPKQDPVESYYNPTQNETKKSATPSRLDYVGITTNLLKVCMNQLDGRNFETYCRRVSKTRVAQLAVLPKLIDSCAEALVQVANEESLLGLYDYCRHQELDPVQLHSQCTVLTPNACYRIQYDSVRAHMFFCYIPAGEDLLTAPRDDDSFMKVDNGDDTHSSVQSDDVGDAKSEARMDFADLESSRPLKKTKLK